MSTQSGIRLVGGRADDGLRVAAAALAYVVAAVHLFHPEHGFTGLVRMLATDPALLSGDPRPLVFVSVGLVLVAGVPAAAYWLPERAASAAGALLAIGYAGGYVAWHRRGHGGFLPGRQPVRHEGAPRALVRDHVAAEPLAATAVAAAVLLAAVLAALVLLTR